MAHVFEKKWRSNDVRLEQVVDFTVLLLKDRVLDGLNKARFNNPSPIQLQAVPWGKFGKDLMVQAKSGTGKTLVFVIVALEMLKRKLFRPQVLIIVPAREIAVQICNVIKDVGSGFPKLTCASFIGGTAVLADQEKASTTQIVVGTPGRLKHLITQGSLPTDSIQLLVFDEADELLRDAGKFENTFIIDIDDIFKALPTHRQIIATSATFNREVKKRIGYYMRNPFFIHIDEEYSLLGMIHYAAILKYIPAPYILNKFKIEMLENILRSIKFTQCLIYCNGICRVNMLHPTLKKWGFSVACISSADRQEKRQESIQKLQKFKCRVLVSSDLTSRGIDVENVDLVINFDLAPTTETYVHRVGRAGRFGSIGAAISIITEKEFDKLKSIEIESSFKTYKLPDPIPSYLISTPVTDEFVINDTYSEDENAESSQAKCFPATDTDNAFGSDLASAENDVETKDSEKEFNKKNIQATEMLETQNDVYNDTIENLSEFAADLNPRNDNITLNVECKKENRDCIFHESEFDDSELSQEENKVAKETLSPSFDSDYSETSSVCDSEGESGLETENSASGLSESSSDVSDSSSNDSSEDEENINESNHLNYSYRGRQNHSFASGSVRNQVLNDRVITKNASNFQYCRSVSHSRNKKEKARYDSHSSQVLENPSYFFDHGETSYPRRVLQTRSGRGQNFDDHNSVPYPSPTKHHKSRHSSSSRNPGKEDQERNESLSYQKSSLRKHSKHHKSRHSSSNLNPGRGHQERNAFLSHQRSAGHHNHNHHNSDFLPIVNRCHPQMPEFHYRQEQNIVQVPFSRKCSKCHKSKHSSRNSARKREDQSRNVFLPHQRSDQHHHHTLSCFMPTTHRCHPNTPEFHCSQGHICEMWYKMFYHQWLHIQRVINWRY